MKIGPKYKIARRLGASIFEKTQTAKFNASKENRKPTSRPKSAFGIQLNEKQKARLTYGITEKQFRNIVKTILEKNSATQAEDLFQALELRLDNFVFRSGFSPSRQASRQAVSHGHIKVNGKKINIPSFKLKVGDEVEIKTSSLSKGLFKELAEKLKNTEAPSWIAVEIKDSKSKVVNMPRLNPTELLFDIPTVFEYYRR